jgi:hypothetical protein
MFLFFVPIMTACNIAVMALLRKQYKKEKDSQTTSNEKEQKTK